MPLSRAAAASSAVPVVLSPITLNNYGGTCNCDPARLGEAVPRHRQSAAARRTRDTLAQGTSKPSATAPTGPISISSTAACRTTWACAACSMRWRSSKRCTKPACRRRSTARSRIIVFVVNSLSVAADQLGRVGDARPARWTSCSSRRARRSTRFSYEAVELLKDTAARWKTLRLIRNSAAFAANKDPAVAAALRVPDAEIYAIDVSFAALKDKAELDYLNRQPTSFVLPPEAVDRLRAAAGTIIMDSPEFKRLLKDLGAKIVVRPKPSAPLPAVTGTR